MTSLRKKALRGRSIVLAGVATVMVATPAFALDTPVQVPTVVPTVVAVPTVPVPVPTVVPTTVPVPVPTVRLPAPTAVPTVQAPVPTVPPVSGGGGGGSSSGGGGGGGATGSSSGGGGGGSSTGGGSSGGGTSGAGASGGGGSAGTGSPRGGSSPAGGGSRSGSAAGATPARSGPAGAARDGSAPARAERIRLREQRLRTTVTRRQGCLGDLSRPQRRVLVLRAGLGPGPPLSRTRVARRLDTTLKRVARLERSGLRRLRGLCGGSPALGAPGTASTATLAADITGTVSPQAGDVSAPSGTDGGGASGGSRRAGGGGGSGGGSSSDDTGGDSRGGVAGVSQTHLPGSGGGANLTIPLILLLLAAGMWGLSRRLRHRDAAPEPAPAAPEPPPATPRNWMDPPPEWADPPPASRR